MCASNGIKKYLYCEQVFDRPQGNRARMINHDSTACPNLTALPDEELLLLYLEKHNQEAVIELVRRYQHTAFRVAFSRCGNQEWAEDAVQEAFLLLAQPSFKPSQVTGAFKPWFIGVVSNRAAYKRRYEQRISSRSRSLRYQNEVKAMYANLDAEQRPACNSEMRATLAAALVDLKEDLRVPIMLHYLDGMTQNQVAEIVGITQANVSRRITQGLELLRLRLKEAGLPMTSLALTEWLRTDGLLDAPAGLQAKLSDPSFFENTLRASQRIAPLPTAEARTVFGVTLSAILRVVVLCGAILLGGGLLLHGSPAETPIAPALPVSNNSPVPAALKRKSWDFNTGIPREFASLEVGYTKTGGLDGSGCLELQSKNFIALNLSNMRLPLRISAKLLLPNAKTEVDPTFYARWEAYTTSVLCVQQTQGTEPGDDISDAVWMSFQIVVTRDSIIQVGNQQNVILALPQEGARFLLGSSGNSSHMIDNLCVEEVEDQDVPDIATIRKALERMRAFELPTGAKREIPDLRSPSGSPFTVASSSKESQNMPMKSVKRSKQAP